MKNIYFLGIGGIGMSALARYFQREGCAVSGYDRTVSPLTLQMESEGIAIHYEEDISKIPENIDTVIYTPAVPTDNNEWKYLKSKNIPFVKRAWVLGKISESYFTIALAGTHGKTSMTTLVSLLCRGKEPVTAFIGGIAANFKSNWLHDPQSNLMVVEADEFDRSFLQLHPDIAVVSAMDPDHLDVYHNEKNLREAFDSFSKQIQPGGCLFTKPALRSAFHTAANVFTYSLEDGKADFYATAVKVTENGTLFDLHTPHGLLKELLLPTAGLYNVENAVAAVAVAMQRGVTEEQIRRQLSSYLGVKRRFEYIIRRPGRIYIDDYAHHPNELKACIESARRWHPGKKICGVFQPHLYTRTRDFADQFAAELSTLDQVVLLDIYPAREQPIEGVDSQMLLNKIQIKEKYLCSKQSLVSLLKQLNPEVLLTMGAGDIDRLVETIKNELQV